MADRQTTEIAPRAPGALDSALAGRVAAGVLGAAVLLPVPLVLLTGVPDGETVLLAIGRTAGLVGLAVLCLQPVLSGRLRVLDRPLGHDRLTRWHRGLAVCAVLLLLAHPMLLALGYGSTWLFELGTPWEVTLGKAALIVVVGVVAVALGRRAIRLDYRIWRAAHKGALAVAAAGFVHGWFAGTGMAMSLPLRVYIGALLGLALGVFTWRNLGVPLRGRRRFVVRSVTPESHNVCTLGLEPADGRPFRYLPGQFAFLKLMGRSVPHEEHPFTMSSSPTRADAVTLTVKASGDFAARVPEATVGDAALLEAPFGRFSLVHYPAAPGFVMLAGGVGITPIVSMLRYLRDTGDPRPVTVIAANRTEEDILFGDELSSLPAQMRVVHVLSRAGDGWAGPRGHVDEALLRDTLAGEMDGREFFLCGPPGMMRSAAHALRRLGVPAARLHAERFAL